MIQENVEHPCYCTHAFYKLVFLFSLFFVLKQGLFAICYRGLLPGGLAATLLMMQNLNLNVNFLSLSLSLFVRFSLSYFRGTKIVCIPDCYEGDYVVAKNNDLPRFL
jgi:hypothetical protein